jgi:Tol biopolymer transport system component
VSFNRFGWRGITAQTWLVRLDGTEAHPVTKARLGAVGASWSPNSRVLYLQGGPPSGLGLHIFRSPAQGGHVRQLTFTDWPNGDYNPAISPSGAQIAFISDRTHPDLCCQDLYVMNVDGSSQRFIETGLSLPGTPDWGTAPLQSGPSVQLKPLTPDELAAGQARARAIEQTWTTRYGKVG